MRTRLGLLLQISEDPVAVVWQEGNDDPGSWGVDTIEVGNGHAHGGVRPATRGNEEA